MRMRVYRDESFGTWLSAKMAEVGLTQVEMAAAMSTGGVSVTQGMVSNWVNDKKTPSPRHCDRISAVLAVDIDEVLTRAGHRPELASDVDGEVREVIATLRQLPAEDRQMALEFVRWRLAQARQRRLRPAGA